MLNRKNIITRDDLNEMVFGDVAEAMFSRSDPKGIIYIPEFGEVDPAIEFDFQAIKLKWKNSDVGEITEKYRGIVDEIQNIGVLFSEADARRIKEEEAKKVLSPDSFEVLQKYLKPDYTKVGDKKMFFVLFYAQKLFALAHFKADDQDAVHRQFIYDNWSLYFLLSVIVNKFGTVLERNIQL